MRQGANRGRLSERGHDFYETPECATLALLRCEPLPTYIWEPCAGRGAMSRLLKASGRNVWATDIAAYEGADSDVTPGNDFFAMKNIPPEYRLQIGAIVTNPPFKDADRFVRHALTFGVPVYVLLRLMAIEGAGRSDIIDHHLVRVWAGIERLPMMHREGWTGSRTGNGGAPFAWFVFLPEHRGNRPIELRRMSWRS